MTATKAQAEELPNLPPSYCQLNDGASLDMIREMYDCLGPQTVWTTCVVCWKAWYSVSPTCRFSQPGAQGTSPGVNAPWFALRQSKVLSQWAFDEAQVRGDLPLEYLKENHKDQVEAITSQLVEWQRNDASDAESKTRDIKICKGCKDLLRGTALKPSSGELRRCDFVIDPVWIQKVCDFNITHER